MMLYDCFCQDGRIDYSEFVDMMQDTGFGKMGLKVSWRNKTSMTPFFPTLIFSFLFLSII